MRESQAPVWRNAISTSAIAGRSEIAGVSRSLRPASAIARRLPTGSGPRSSPSHALNTGPVPSVRRGLTSRTGVPARSFFSDSSSVPVPFPTQASDRTQAGTSAPSRAARACQSAGRPAVRSTKRKTAPASAEPPPSPAATGRRLSSDTAQPVERGNAERVLATILSKGSLSCELNSPNDLRLSRSAGTTEISSPASTNANSVSSLW